MSEQRLLTHSLFTTLASLAAISCASSSKLTPLNLAVRTVEDTVVMHRNSNTGAFDVTAVMRNKESQSVDVDICVTPAQIQIDGVWTTVFKPSCLTSGMAPLAAGDSLVLPVNVFGYIRPNAEPRLDPRMGPGRYRLLFYVRLSDAAGPSSPAPGRAQPSNTFIVK